RAQTPSHPGPPNLRDRGSLRRPAVVLPSRLRGRWSQAYTARCGGGGPSSVDPWFKDNLPVRLPPCHHYLMNKPAQHVWLAGVDGCAAGWIAAFVRPADGTCHIEVFARFADVLNAPTAPAVVTVDIPIGLPERAGVGGRTAENIVRPLLGERQSSVFS